MGIAFRTGDGRQVKIGKDELRDIQDEVRLITSDSYLGIGGVTGRALADELRFCRWAGQSTDGRKSKSAQNKDPFPFDGCSDARIPLVDMVAQEGVDLLCNATSVSISGPGVMGITGVDSEHAGLLDDLLTWEFRNGIGSAWRIELERLANYVLGDNPGIGVLKVWWTQKNVVAPRTLTLAEFITAAANLAQQQPVGGLAAQDVAGWMQRAAEEGRADDLAGILQELVGSLVSSSQELRVMAQELIDDGKTTYPIEFVGENHAAVRALRPYEDVFWRPSARNIQDAPIVLEREWMTVGQALARAAAADWSEEFTAKLLGAKGGSEQAGAGRYGLTMFPDNEKEPGAVLDVNWSAKVDAYKDQVEVVTAYFRGVDARGIEGVYYTTLNTGIDFAAHDGKPVEYMHGQYPFVDFQAEYLRDTTCDSRGVSEKLGSHQQQLKLQTDMRLDRTQLNTIPPVTGPMRLAGQTFKVQPGGYIEQPRLGMLTWMPMAGSGAVESKNATEDIMAFVNQYAKRSVDGVPPDLVQTARQALVGKWLERMADVVRMIGQLAMQYHTEDRKSVV